MSAMPSVAGIIHSVPMHCIQASVMGYMMVVVRNCALAEARQRLALGDHAPAVRRLARILSKTNQLGIASACT